MEKQREKRKLSRGGKADGNEGEEEEKRKKRKKQREKITKRKKKIADRGKRADGGRNTR